MGPSFGKLPILFYGNSMGPAFPIFGGPISLGISMASQRHRDPRTKTLGEAPTKFTAEANIATRVCSSLTGGGCGCWGG